MTPRSKEIDLLLSLWERATAKQHSMDDEIFYFPFVFSLLIISFCNLLFASWSLVLCVMSLVFLGIGGKRAVFGFKKRPADGIASQPGKDLGLSERRPGGVLRLA